MKPASATRLHVMPITYRQAAAFVAKHHRHNKEPRGCKFCIATVDDAGTIRGIAMAGRPIARSWDDGVTLEINRTCTDGHPNANSFLYAACWRIAREMGYRRVITYSQRNEPGTSLRAAGYRVIGERQARPSWRDATRDQRLFEMRDADGNGGVPRTVWEIKHCAV